MDTIQDQVQALQTSVRRQRFAIVTLASILAGSALIGAVRPAGDATFDMITCKEWKVVDKDGKVRISARTFGSLAKITWSDVWGEERLVAETTSSRASVEWKGFDEGRSISVSTSRHSGPWFGNKHLE